MSWVASHTKQQGGGSSPAPTTGYVRPEEWLTMPVLTEVDQQLSMLIAVANDITGLNKIAFTVSGNYTVDWGDGSTVESFNAGVKAEHTYAWGDISSTTMTSEGYRQCICTVTPQSGQSLTAFDIRVWPTTYPILWRQPILSFVGASANITSIGFSGSTPKIYAPTYLLKEITIPKLGNITDLSYAWYRCSSLQSLSVDTSKGINFYNAWSGCSSLQSLSVDTSKGTNLSFAWNGCSSLQSLSVNTSEGTNFSSTWSGCSSLQSLSVDTSKGTTFYNAWNGCSSLQSLSVNTSEGTNFERAWSGCSSLQSLSVDTSKGTNLSYAWYGCLSLQSLSVNTSEGINFSSTWSGCSSLQSLSAISQPLSFSVSDCKLSVNAIAALFTSLGTVTGQTVTCSGCFGYAALSTEQREIATNKGWTIA